MGGHTATPTLEFSPDCDSSRFINANLCSRPGKTAGFKKVRRGMAAQERVGGASSRRGQPDGPRAARNVERSNFPKEKVEMETQLQHGGVNKRKNRPALWSDLWKFQGNESRKRRECTLGGGEKLAKTANCQGRPETSLAMVIQRPF